MFSYAKILLLFKFIYVQLPWQAAHNELESKIFINKIFTGEDCVKNFYRYLKQNSERFLDIVNPEEPCPAFKAPDEIELFDKQKSCGYCGKTFTNKI